MNKSGFPSSYKVYVPLAVFFAGLLLLMPGNANFKYDYKKGSPWMYETLIAQFDFPILKTAAQLQEERNSAGTGVIPYYRYSDDVVEERLVAVEYADLGKYNSLKPKIRNIISGIYSKGVISEHDGDSGEKSEVIYVQRDKRALKYPLSEAYRVSEAKAKILSEMRRIAVDCDADSLCRYSGIYDIIVPNLEFDPQTTELVHDEAANYISPTSGIVNAGQLIVSNGEMITAEIEQLLDSYKAEYDRSFGYDGPGIMLWGGNTLLALLLVVLLFFTIYYSNPLVFNDFNRYCYVLTVVFIAALVTFLVERAGHQLVYMIPFSLIALYLVAFFKWKVVFPVYIVSLLPLLIFAHNGIELFVMYLVAGVVAIYSFRFFNKGWQQFVTAFFVYLSLLVTFFTFRLIEGMAGFSGYKEIFYMGLGSLFSVAGYPLIYLFERIFALVSNSRLIELSDTNNKVLRDLAHKAPGTFQHSLQVMNMVDAAARAIDANVQLVRCGALYHDIGKTLNPQCFIENETAGNKYHEGLTPLESARDIIRHVRDGYNIAEKAGLPEVIRDFIITHHGTTCTAYFYSKFTEAGGDPSRAEEFYYKGKKPATKEQVILMVCDTLEAASRTLKDFSPESISEFVERIFRGKMQDGQFEDSDISLKEINVLKNVLKEYLQQVHHARVAYPKRTPAEN